MQTILSIVRKEALQVLRDRIMRIQILVPPILQLLILSQAATFEVKDSRVFLIDEDRTPASQRLVEHFAASGRFRVVATTANASAATDALLARTADLALRIPDDFERDLRRTGRTSVQFLLNAEDGAAAGVVQSYAVRILDAYSAEQGAVLRANTGRVTPRLDVRTRGWYNLDGDYLDYMALGFLALLTTLVGTLLTAQNIAREKELGTLEQLNVTPISKAQFIAGKLLPFWILGLFELTLGLIVIKIAFHTPFVGNLGLVYLLTAVYLVVALGVGLLISTVAQTQQQAMFITFFVLVIYMFLSGLFTPVASMPGWVQVLAELNPIKHFVWGVRGVLMKGMTLADLAVPLGALTVFSIGALTLAVLRYRKTSA